MKNKLLILAALPALLLGIMDGAFAKDIAWRDFISPTGLACGRDGSLYVSEWSAGRVTRIKDAQRRVVLDGLASPAGLAFDDAGNLYIAGYGDGNIYVWNGKDEPKVIASGLSAPTGLFWKGSLLCANRNAGEVVEIDDAGNKKVISRGHKTPVGVVRADDGSLFVSCYGGSVDIIAPDGNIVSISEGFSTPGAGIVPAGKDAVFVVDYAAGDIARLNAAGERRIVASGLPSPVGLAAKPDGGLIVGCWGDNSLHDVKTDNLEER